MQEPGVTMVEWNGVVLLHIAADMPLKALKETTQGYRDAIARLGDFLSVTILELEFFPKLNDEQKAEVRVMGDVTRHLKKPVVQWVMGDGIINATLRVMLSTLNLLTSRRIKTVRNEEDLVQFVLSHEPRLSGDELRATLRELRAYSRKCKSTQP